MKATEAQIRYLEGLGVKVSPSLTKDEASIMISGLVRKKEKIKLQQKREDREKRRAMSEHFLDQDSVMDSIQTQSRIRKLTGD